MSCNKFSKSDSSAVTFRKREDIWYSILLVSVQYSGKAAVGCGLLTSFCKIPVVLQTESRMCRSLMGPKFWPIIGIQWQGNGPRKQHSVFQWNH